MKKTKIKIGDKIFNVLVADTLKKRKKGLQHVESLPEKTGMIFLFDRPNKHPFWMKNTKIPLTIMYVDESDTVFEVQHRSDTNSKRMTYPDKDAISVIEVPMDENLNSLVGENVELVNND